MITDFIKLILRIVFFNPMTLIGIGVGIYIMQGEGMNYFNQILENPRVYAVQAVGILWAIAVVYALLFKHVYKIDGQKINWWGTFTSSFWHLGVILLAILFTCVICWALDYNWGDKLDRYARNQRTQDTLPPINQ